MSGAAPKLEETWRTALDGEFQQPYMAALKRFLQAEREAGHVIHPPPARFFAALDRTPLPAVKAVILGQDPYHGAGQAHGFSFSVQHGVRPPPSLRNIFTELRDDLGIQPPDHGCLEGWADQGVLLLNSVLSVRTGSPASHADKGWERFTDAIISAVNDRPGHVAFILWGNYARKKAASVDRSRHLVIESPHPSPFSAHAGFFGSRPFSRVNAFLREHGVAEIDWSL